jgi:hypothetical protein
MMNTTTKEAVIIGDLLEIVMKRMKDEVFPDNNKDDSEETPIFTIGMNTMPEFPHAA